MRPTPATPLVVDSCVLDWSQDLPSNASSREIKSQLDAIRLMNCIDQEGFSLALSDDLYKEIASQVIEQKNNEYFVRRSFARDWFRRMENGNRMPELFVPSENVLVPEDTKPKDVLICGTMVKDHHLIESALSSGGAVISRDEDVLYCWIGYCHTCPLPDILVLHKEIPNIVWADPSIHTCDALLEWLKSGAPLRESWMLGRQALARHCKTFGKPECQLSSGTA